MALGVPNRELSATEILSRSLGLYSARFECFLVPFLITNLVNSALGHFMGSLLPSLAFPQNLTEEFLLWLMDYLALAIPLTAAIAILGWVISTVSTGVAVKCASDMLEGKPVSLRKGFDTALSSLSSLLTAGFTVGVLVVLGLIVFVVPGVIVAIMFSQTVQVILIERLGASQSLRRSRKLVANRWGKTISVLFSVFIIVGVTYVIAEAIGDYVAVLFEGITGASLVFRLLISSVIASGAQPLYPIALTYLYYSLRTREKPIVPTFPVRPEVPVVQPPVRPSAPILPGFQPRFCYKCGQNLPSDAVYCPRCGVRVRT